MPHTEDNAIVQPISSPWLIEKNINLYLKREDLIHREISGNKWRKLKYNLQQAKTEGKEALLTFGGAFSNHLVATAAAGREFGFRTIGIIRGEEHAPLNTTLAKAQADGMELHYMDRTAYKDRNNPEFLTRIAEQFPKAYILPEGGSNVLAVRGASEILKGTDPQIDLICCSVGTGGTLAGIVKALNPNQKAIGIAALKGGEFLEKEVIQFAEDNQSEANWHIETEYHHGGYARITDELVAFMQEFYHEHGIILDYIYTGKMMHAVYDMIAKGVIPGGKSILAVHTGGLQGNPGMEKRYSLPSLGNP